MAKKMDFPDFDFKFRLNNMNKEIFDVIRKKWVKLTAEEWVRQNVIVWLNLSRNIPLSHISSESGLTVNRMNKRTDIVVYGDDMAPFLVVECKSPKIELTDEVILQAINYNTTLKAKFIIVTNGEYYLCFRLVDQRYIEDDF